MPVQALCLKSLRCDAAGADVANALHRAMYVALVAAILLRMLFALPTLVHPERSFVPGDSERYHRLAMNIALKQRFSINHEPYFLRPPAYPAFLAFLYRTFGVDVRFAVLAQIVVSALTLMLVGMLTKALFGDGAAHATVLFAINPLSIAMCVVLMSETLFGALICGALVAFSRGCLEQFRDRHGNVTWWFVACGMLIGIAALCRSVAVGTLPLLAAFALFACRRCSFRIRATQSLALVIAALLIISPWMLRNRIILGRWLIDINGQVTLVFFASQVLSERYNMSLSESDEALLKLASERYGWSYTSSDASNLHIFCEHHPTKAIELSQVARHIVLTEWKVSLHRYLEGCLLVWLPFISYSTLVGTLHGEVPQQPKGASGLSVEVLRKLLKLRFGEAFKLAVKERFGRYPLVTLLWFATLLTGLCIFALAIVGLFAVRGNALALLLTITVALYFTIAGGIAGHFNLSRLRMPIEPLLCAAAGNGLRWLFTVLQKRATRQTKE